MKYLRPKKKGVKIRVSPSHEITVMMYDVVRVEYRVNIKGAILDGYVTIMSMTGEAMKYQSNARMPTKRRYIVEMLKNKRQFNITDSFKFITLS